MAWQMGNVLAFKFDSAAVVGKHTANDFDRCGFAHSIAPHKRCHLTRLYREINPVKRLRLAIKGSDIGQLQKAVSSSPR